MEEQPDEQQTDTSRPQWVHLPQGRAKLLRVVHAGPEPLVVQAGGELVLRVVRNQRRVKVAIEADSGGGSLGSTPATH